eukprot:TRINITY_DN1315_c0_g1_i1.p1 TRINITY_DN1315_c0_g1~~TRINITY_DN1315_c0_g1_i1.p1  ORF type:complete len:338 (+),score=58.93 TRINITY_DN1315_c0_g1_i1:123-1016(+)
MFPFGFYHEVPEPRAQQQADFMAFPDPLLFFLASQQMPAGFMFQEEEERAQQPATSSSALQALPEIKVTESDIRQTEEATCSICLESFSVGDKATRIPCGHFFHPGCIKEWLRNSNQCALCRYELATDDANYEARRKASQRTLHLRRSELKRRTVPELRFLATHLSVDSSRCIEKTDLVECIVASGCVVILPERDCEAQASSSSDHSGNAAASEVKSDDLLRTSSTSSQMSNGSCLQRTLSITDRTTEVLQIVPEFNHTVEKRGQDQDQDAAPVISDAASHYRGVAMEVDESEVASR